jgi:L-lactate utilization protein LutC
MKAHALSSADDPASLPDRPSLATTKERLERLAETLRSHRIDAVVVATGAEARQAVLALIPDGAEVHSGKSRTLEEIGLYAELVESGRYDALRPKMFRMDRATQGREIRKMVAAPDVMVGSVAAITEDGTLVAASATGSQLGAYASGAGRLILVLGSQKVVPDLAAALRRIAEDVTPWENDQVRARLGVDTSLEKVLLLYGEWQPGRTTVILVEEPVGI